MHLLTLPDEAVLAALALVMAETLEAGTALIEMLGRHLKLDMAETHAVDDVLLDLVKDREGLDRDRKSAVEGKSVSVRVDLGGRRILKKRNNTQTRKKTPKQNNQTNKHKHT